MEMHKVLQKYNKDLDAKHLRDLITEPGRFPGYCLESNGLLLDFTRVRMDDAVRDALLQLADARGLAERRQMLFEGGHVNATEDRPALHMALRTDEVLDRLPAQDAARVRSSTATMLAFAGELHEGRLPGQPGTRIRHIIHVGIGGSLLGPRLVCEALDTGSCDLQVHFIGSVDAHTREQLLRRLDPAETAVVLVSKSFSTGDTLLHGRRLQAWLHRHLDKAAAAARVFAVTSNADKAVSEGVSRDNILYLPDWVGGRYSLWSAVSLSAAALIGPQRFTELLTGAASMDRHFLHTESMHNLPVMYALIGVWHRNYCGFASWGVIPYDQRLRLLPAYLQQLVMESNGKSVTSEGQPVPQATSPVVFGETGTEAQHSLFQAMHQGSDIVPLNLIGIIRPDHDDLEAHNELLANMLAQATALAVGRPASEVRTELEGGDERLVAQRTFAGNRPTEVIMLDQLTPRLLGKLLALYEHKVFVESVIWEINAFDQWGVELGKVLAPGIQAALEADQPGDGAMSGLLAHIKARREA